VASYVDDHGTPETFFGTATAPVINLPGAPLGLSLDTFFVSESALAGQALANVIVDDDIGDTHTFELSDRRFEIVNGQLRLVAGAHLDDADGGPGRLTPTGTDQARNSRPLPVRPVGPKLHEAPDADPPRH